MKLRIKTDLTQFPVDGTVAIDPTDIKDCIVIDEDHTWIKLTSGRMYRTRIPLLELRQMIKDCKHARAEKVESDKICKTRAEAELENLKERMKK